MLNTMTNDDLQGHVLQANQRYNSGSFTDEMLRSVPRIWCHSDCFTTANSLQWHMLSTYNTSFTHNINN